MLAALKNRFKAMFVALITMSIVACAFLAPQNAEAGFSGGFRGGSSFSSRSYSYSAPRAVYVAPRPVLVPRPAVIIAPRPIFTPRPVIVVRPSYYPRPVIVAPIIPYVQPTQVVQADGAPLAEVPVIHDQGWSSLEIFVVTLLIILVIAGAYGGYGYYSGWYCDPFAIDALIATDLAVDMAYDFDGGFL